MNEKVLAESKRGILERICLILFILSVIMGISVSITSGGKALLPVLVAYIVPTGLLALLTAPVEMTVTTERVYGTGSWGKKVDLPIDTISSISSSILGGIIIGTSSGRIKFAGLGNKKEIYRCISDLLVARQKTHTAVVQPQAPAPTSAADELAKYKNLLDSGVITQAEFDAKKKEVLGL